MIDGGKREYVRILIVLFPHREKLLGKQGVLSRGKLERYLGHFVPFLMVCVLCYLH